MTIGRMADPSRTVYRFVEVFVIRRSNIESRIGQSVPNTGTPTMYGSKYRPATCVATNFSLVRPTQAVQLFYDCEIASIRYGFRA